MSDEEERRFTELYRRHYVDVLRYVRRRLDPEATGDVVAETFLVAWRRLDRVPEDPLPWLYGVARNAVANRRRATGRQDRLQQRVRDPAAGTRMHEPDHAEQTTEALRISGALAQLSSQDQDAVRLVTWERLSIKDAASALGCSRVAMAVRLHRARRRLAELLSADIEGLPSSRAHRDADTPQQPTYLEAQ